MFNCPWWPMDHFAADASQARRIPAPYMLVFLLFCTCVIPDAVEKWPWKKRRTHKIKNGLPGRGSHHPVGHLSPVPVGKIVFCGLCKSRPRPMEDNGPEQDSNSHVTNAIPTELPTLHTTKLLTKTSPKQTSNITKHESRIPTTVAVLKLHSTKWTSWRKCFMVVVQAQPETSSSCTLDYRMLNGERENRDEPSASSKIQYTTPFCAQTLLYRTYSYRAQEKLWLTRTIYALNAVCDVHLSHCCTQLNTMVCETQTCLSISSRCNRSIRSRSSFSCMSKNEKQTSGLL